MDWGGGRLLSCALKRFRRTVELGFEGALVEAVDACVGARPGISR